MSYKWKPSKAKVQEFKQKMDDVSAFCADHGIEHSLSMDSFYFFIAGKSYRVSNHTVERSNAGAVNALGERLREDYHPDGRNADTVYIHASKTRIIDIYNDLQAGYVLDGRGYRK